jgi:DNA-binding CsgD family transcriptional regulator/tetratricopeptide (TPR) repeat protein
VLIGREAERGAIDRLVAGSRIGNSAVLAVTGEPGVGKTVLLDYARAGLAGFRVLAAVGVEPEREIPFSGLLSLLRPALALLDRIPAPQAAALSEALALREGRAGDRFAIGAATLSLVCRYAEEAPVAVVVDDLHLLDRPSAEALVFAARRLSADPVAVLLAARTGEADDLVDGLPRLALAGLDLGSARDLVRATATVPLTDGQVHRLHEVTGGNPLAIVELGNHPEVIESTDPVAPPPVSATLVAAFARRVRSLSPPARAALLVAAVTGGDLRLTSAACALLRQDAGGLAEAEDVGLVGLSGGRIGFRHPLLRSAVYADASPEARRSAHRAVAEILPADDPDRRAWHLAAATWQPDAQVAGLLAATAGRAVSRAAYAVASTAYERASRLAAEPVAQEAWLARAAETAWAAGQATRARDLLDELGGRAGGAVTLQLRAAIAAATGSLAQALEMLERAAHEAASAETRVALLADAVQAAFYLADTAGARRLVPELARSLEATVPPLARALGLMAIGVARVITGEGGADDIRAATALLAGRPELSSDPRLQQWLMVPALFLRDVDTDAGRLRETVDVVRARAGVGTLPSLLFHIARDQAASSSWQRAEANYGEGIRLARETGQSTELALCLAGLAWLESRQGRAEECRAHAAEAASICTDRDIHLGQTWVLFALGDLELGLGDPRAAVERFGRLQELLDTLGLGDPDLSPRAELTEALLRLGHDDEAARVAQECWTAAGAKGQPWACARAQRALGLVATGPAMDEAFGQALVLHGATLDDFETSRTRLAYGVRLRRAGRRVDAREQLRAAMDGFGRLGAGRWGDLAAVELDATGEKVHRRDPSGVESLTSQELQVSLLLVEGRTTREAAAALFLSPKTVEYHLRKVYAKLAIRSRAELADLLAQ